ncbi:MAG TPA: trypsin-like peptidase domain-containing protein [Candidatus Saccharimonadales bacterium]|nr:trypsin-like peptidase domain-containing protein [Candidatus Saccharimonadales bacterium]
MSEFLSSRTIIAGAALIGSAAVMSSCTGTDSYPRVAQLARCEATPQTPPTTPPQPNVPSAPPLPPNPSPEQLEQIMADENAQQAKFDQALAAWDNALVPPSMEVHVTDGFANGDPITVPPDQVNATSSALVEITTKDWKGSGFVTRDAFGQEVVVTAAHVVGTATMNQLTITTDDGLHVHPTGGCYIYDEDGAFKPLSSPLSDRAPLVATDVAVLTLPENISSQPLPLSDRRPEAGSWLNYVNYQGNFGPKNSLFSDDTYTTPASYVGLVEPTSAVNPDIEALTGTLSLGKNMTVGTFETWHLVGGASGGPVEDQSGDVIGISVQGTRDGMFLDSETLNEVYHVKFDGVHVGADTGFEPTNSVIVPSSVIRQALASPVLAPGIS